MSIMDETKVISANVEVELVDWADAKHAALGYSSRSRLINDAIEEKKDRDDPEWSPEDQE